ncbi:MAG: ribonuclease III [Bacteroidetes bacterium HGW-Bacteroidetes-13]|nr:MAG: ribonuclease III [Bacteroidetes bacterium HGW-Bacteroidetes-13]
MPILKKIFNSRSDKDWEFFLFIKNTLGFTPSKISWYKIAFTHSSAKEADAQGNPINYERMEFLGDSVLGTVISAYLLKEAPFGNEGYLTQMRSKIVSREHLNELGRELLLINFAQSKIPKNHYGDNIHGNLFEALVGAIYLDKGFNYCEKFINKRVIFKHVDIKQLEGKIISYKSLIIEWCQKEKKAFRFDISEDNGKEAVQYFSVKLFIDEKQISKARGTSKKKAEEKAAQRAFFALQNQINQKIKN